MLSTPAIRYGVLTLVGVLAVGMVCLGLYHYQAEGRTLQFVAGQDRKGESAAASPPAAASDKGQQAAAREQTVIVHVTGAVAVPGVYRLVAGARVNDALEAAGGAKPEGMPHALNLARHLADGDKIYVPTAAELEPPSPSQPVGSPAAQGATVLPVAAETTPVPAADERDGKLSLNKASAAELDQQISGIGKATAEAIVAYRTKNGPFKSVEELQKVSSYCAQHWDEWLPSLSL
ncbi:MAG: helix-hairpin-helix domain-containing protein [Mycobacterium leprae]